MRYLIKKNVMMTKIYMIDYLYVIQKNLYVDLKIIYMIDFLCQIEILHAQVA